MLDEMIRMHQKRWMDAGEPGSFADPDFCRFIHASAQRFLLEDRLYLPLLIFNGQPIGGEINMIGRDRIMYSYSAGYDNRLPRHGTWSDPLH